jgi:hypothetical protein
MFKKKIILLISTLFLLASSSAYCADNELFPSSEFKIGYEGMYMYYDEPNVMNERGYLNGGFASWTGYFSEYDLMASFEAEAVAGSMDYDGKYSNGDPLKCDTDDFLITGRALFGKGYELGDTGLTPYIGIGIRHWYDKIKAPGGYERYITQYYLPVGLNVINKLDDKWSIGGTLEGNLLLAGRVKSKLSQVGTGYENAENDQDFASGGGGRISVFAEYDLDGYALGIEPYFRYWYFSESNKDTVLYGGTNSQVVEPKNKFYMGGFRLYVKF